MPNSHRFTPDLRPFLGLLVVAALATMSASSARAVELIPSFGMTKATDTNAGDAQAFGGLALRTRLLPILKLEGGIAYRQDSFLNDAIKVRQWPVSASLWITPVPALYFGGGVGWYHTTVDLANPLFKDTTTDKAGVHVGGGVVVPLGAKLSLDLAGRYIFMTKDKASFDVPTTFNPDYWTASAGLAISL